MTAFAIEERRLENGLRVIISEDHVAPVVAVNLWYDVGSRHEQQGLTGLAHLFEHLMFEGSRQVTAGEHFKVTTTCGGSLNGTTSTERTNYYETLPSAELDAALWLEADRMGSLLEALTQESLDKQRDVVRNERRQRVDNVPYGDAMELLCERLFPPGHPYAHQPIGSMDDLARAALDDVHDFFRGYYAPNNAVLTIAGDVTPDHAMSRVAHYFGGIAANPAIRPAPGGILEGRLMSDVRHAVEADVPDPAVFLGYRLPAEPDVQLDHLEVALAALTVGRGSAFHRRLVQAELAKAAMGFCDRRVAGASLGVFYAIAGAGVPMEKLEAALRSELDRLGDVGPTEGELARAKAVFERQWLQRVGSLEGRADEISRHAVVFGDPEVVNRRLQAAMEATASEVREAVSEFLSRASAAVVTYAPRMGASAR